MSNSSFPLARIVLEVRPGEGGDDAALFATEVAESIRTFVRAHSKLHVREERGRTILLYLCGDDVDIDVTFLAGVHRIQRMAANDRRGRRHTSTATVAVLNETTYRGTDAASEEVLCDDDLRVDYYRGHGKGGQHRNKTSSAVRLTHLPTGVTVAIERGRSQSQNYDRAYQELTRRLRERHQEKAAKHLNGSRVRQIASGERPVKQWTWNAQRGEVLHHASGRRYAMAAFLKGDFPQDLIDVAGV